MPLPSTVPTLTDAAGVILRAPADADVEAMIEMCRDPEMQRWTTVPVPYSAADAREFLGFVRTAWRDGAGAAFAIEADGRYAGSVDLRLREASWAEVGYGLGPWARGRHVMRRALTLLLDWGFDDLGLDGVHWQAHVGNDSSRHVAVSCGFRVEGEVRGLCVQRGVRVDAWIGSLLASDRRP